MHTETFADALIARQDGIVEKTKLQKLMYYSNAWHLAITGAALVPLPFQAWVNGPVLPGVWHSRADDAQRDARGRKAPRLEPFTARLLDMVTEEYGWRSSGELSAMTHGERPWIAARGGIPADSSSRAEIDPAVIAAHYRTEHSLCGVMASELAVLGLPPAEDGTGRNDIEDEHIDVDDLPDDEWGGANLFVVPGTSAR